uniref:Uncharacterized protein n=1 Tax=Glossina austeni TaxID=7395 RepID=A0A1A9VTD3_GLOAU
MGGGNDDSVGESSPMIFSTLKKCLRNYRLPLPLDAERPLLLDAIQTLPWVLLIQFQFLIEVKTCIPLADFSNVYNNSLKNSKISTMTSTSLEGGLENLADLRIAACQKLSR